MSAKLDGRYGKCFICKEKAYCYPRFAAVNPWNGKAWRHVTVNPRTMKLNCPWLEHGSWIMVCRTCRSTVPGLTFKRCKPSECGDPRTAFWDLFGSVGSN